ncbi:hypothetical protein GYMLUDRAFT_63248 [Collybiopsis luxurians FD-317 M1]|uniref:Uncharacterized protein n=1 Tax=Collybiopsis luxurians FD-317 M1 TaxID=944289 RepID=A0A0D0BX23_9AGAR|nr:hypothetical protein GYMLUDRAFT_63248 [Collybiopsis luxurians FD-317 M1]
MISTPTSSELYYLGNTHPVPPGCGWGFWSMDTSWAVQPPLSSAHISSWTPIGWKSAGPLADCYEKFKRYSGASQRMKQKELIDDEEPDQDLAEYIPQLQRNNVDWIDIGQTRALALLPVYDENNDIVPLRRVKNAISGSTISISNLACWNNQALSQTNLSTEPPLSQQSSDSPLDSHGNQNASVEEHTAEREPSTAVNVDDLNTVTNATQQTTEKCHDGVVNKSVTNRIEEATEQNRNGQTIVENSNQATVTPRNNTNVVQMELDLEEEVCTPDSSLEHGDSSKKKSGVQKAYQLRGKQPCNGNISDPETVGNKKGKTAGVT